MPMVLLVLVTVAAGCGSDSATRPPEEPAGLSVSPDAGTPGTVFAITGIVVPAAKVEQTTLLVHGSPSSLTLSPNGQLLGIVPLLAAGTDGGTPPAAPVDVELWQDGVLMARGTGALTVNALTAAPGATADLAAELAALADALRRVSPLLITEPGVEEQWWTAASGALDSLVRGDGPGGLAGAQRELQEQAPATLALLDAYLAGSGVLDRTRMLVSGLRAVAESGPDKTATLTQDVVLARRMQFYVLAKLFGETVVAETAEEFAYVVGMPAGLIGIGADIPAVAVVSAVLAVADFAVNKILLGLLPAELTELTLTLEDTQLLMGEVTTARVDVLARNAPPGVGIQDFVGLMLNVMGVGAGPQTATFAEILEGTAQFYLSTMQQLLSVYSAAHPELGLDISVALVPALEWTATVHDPRLVTRNSFTPDLIAGQPTEVNWRAATNKTGTGAIYTATANGPEALLLDLAPGFTYLGGAFGESVMASATVEIEVTGTLALEIDLPPTIAPGQLVQLDIRAGFVGTEGTGTVWSPGIALSIAANGGSVGDGAGVTGADGSFTTVVELAPGSNAVTVSVTATDAGANAVTKSATAFASAATTIRVADITLVAWCGASAEVRPPNDGMVSDRDEYRETIREEGSLTAGLGASASDSSPEGGAASGSSSVDISAAGFTSGTTVTLNIGASGSFNGSYSLLDDSGFATAGGGIHAEAEILFVIEGGGAAVSLGASSSQEYGSGVVYLRAWPGGTIANLSEFGGAWEGVLPEGTYLLRLERNGSVGGNSFVDETLSRTVGGGASASVSCTITAQ